MNNFSKMTRAIHVTLDSLKGLYYGKSYFYDKEDMMREKKYPEHRNVKLASLVLKSAKIYVYLYVQL